MHTHSLTTHKERKTEKRQREREREREGASDQSHLRARFLCGSSVPNHLDIVFFRARLNQNIAVVFRCKCSLRLLLTIELMRLLEFQA